MIHKLPFDEIVEAVEGLTPEEQADLVHLMQRRLAHIGRLRLITDVKDARQEAAEGRAVRCSPADFSKELES